MNQEYVFYHTPSAILRELPCNAGIDEALERIENLRRRGLNVRVLDMMQMSEHEIWSAYIRDAMPPSVMKRYPIRQIFGSRRQSGFLFGRGVPALIVQAPSGEMAEDVFPHEESGRIVTINQFLSRL
jgi:hypothetical protein